MSKRFLTYETEATNGCVKDGSLNCDKKNVITLCYNKKINLNDAGETFLNKNGFNWTISDLGCKDLIKELLGDETYDILSKWKMHWYITLSTTSDKKEYSHVRGLDLHHVMSREHQPVVDDYSAGTCTRDAVLFPFHISDDSNNLLCLTISYNKIYHGSFSIYGGNDVSTQWIQDHIRNTTEPVTGYDIFLSLYLEEI